MSDNQTKDLAPITQAPTAIVTSNPIDNWFEGSPLYAKLATLADKFSKSELCPEQFKGKTQDCFIALQIATRIGVDPFLALQNIQVIRGKPTWSAQFIISLVNERGPFSDRIKFETKGEGNELAVTAYATLKETGEVAKATVSIAMAVAEGWVSKNTKYKTMPEQMLCYRSAVFLARRHCPELLLGMPTRDEVEDVVVHGARNVGPDLSEKTKKINQKIQEVKHESESKAEKAFI